MKDFRPKLPGFLTGMKILLVNMFKTLSWYDNGYNHASRVLDLIESYNKIEA